MTDFVPDPDVYVPIQEAIARCETVWGDADDDEADVKKNTSRAAWGRLRSKLNSGAVRAALLVDSLGMREPSRDVWATNFSEDCHRTGRVPLSTQGVVWPWPAFIIRSDLEAMLEGKERASSNLETVPAEPRPARNKDGSPVKNDSTVILKGTHFAEGTAAPVPRQPIKRGRPPNPEVDLFWIEICRLIKDGEIPNTQSATIKELTQWSIENMKPPYGEDTIRGKVSELWRRLGWRN